MLGHGPWVLGHGPWVLEHGPWVLGHGPWVLGHGPYVRVVLPPMLVQAVGREWWGVSVHPGVATQ